MTLLRPATSPSAVWLRFCMAFVALNVPHWVVSHWLFISRPVFNIELVLPLLLAAWSLRAALLATAVAWAFDLAVSQARSYHFTSPREFLSSARFLGNIHIEQYFSVDWLLIAFPFVLSAVLALWLTPRRRAPWSAAFAVVAVLSVLDVANGSSMAWQPGTRLLEANIANAPATTLVAGAFSRRPPLRLIAVASDASATGAADLAGWAAQHPEGSVLIVIVESMGLHIDARLRNWLRDQLFDKTLEVKYQLKELTVPVRGATTSAELRELCALHGSYQLLTAATGASCLPAILRNQGWTTVGLHGFSRHMFDRDLWWPLIGLQRQRFVEDLALPGGTRCGAAFAGLCDAALIEAAVAEAETPSRMVYALTLNSHIPLAPTDLPADLKELCQAAKTGDDVCMLTATLGSALRSLRDRLAITSASPKVVVVGDHAPPYAPLFQRNQYRQGQVPAFILSPRSGPG